MQLTKFNHACFSLEQDGHKLIVDPGNWTDNLPEMQSVSIVVITHEHADHCDENLINEIFAANPDAVLVAHSSITSKFPDLPSTSVEAGEMFEKDGFKLDFHGGKHALITDTMPIIANLGVMINDHLYYPGDSFALPEQPVEILALPVSAPWMKISESLSFLESVKPQRVFPTHDAILSDAGKALIDRLVSAKCEQLGAKYERLAANSSIDI